MLVGRGSTSYTQDLVAPLEQVLNDGTTNLVYGHTRIKRSTGAWYQHDGLGSVRAVLDGTGAVQSTTSYDPWGTPQTALADSFGFTGELHDGDLVHLRARWYHPSTGTFTSRDPFAGFDNLPYSLHPYQYAYSNPVLLTDPSGQVAVCGAGAFLPGPVWFAAAACVGVHLLAPIAAGGLGLWLLNDTAQSMQQESSPAQTQPAADPATVAAPAPRLQPAPRPIPAAPPAPPAGEPRPVEPAVPPLAPPAPPAVPRADPDCDVDADADVRTDTQQRTRDYDRHILIVGEQPPFEYGVGLAARHPNWHITTSSFGNGSNSQDVISTVQNLTLVNNVDATQLHRGGYTTSRQFDDIIFNAPRAHPGWQVETAYLINNVLQSARVVLKPNGAVRFSTTDFWPGGPHLNDLLLDIPPGYVQAYRTGYDVDVRFNVHYTMRRNDGTPLVPQTPLYWFAFQKGVQ